MKKCITESQKTKQTIFHQMGLAQRLQGITNKQLSEVLGVTNGRITQIFKDQRMTVDQMCDLAEFLGLEIHMIGKGECDG